MKRQHAFDLLEQSRGELRERFGVTRLALFGSVARDAASDSSDVDILVAFDGPATSKRYFGVQFFLEDLMGCSVDLVTEKALRPGDWQRELQVQALQFDGQEPDHRPGLLLR